MSDVGGEALKFFQAKGLSKAAAAGIVGNMKQESSLNPNAPGGGLIQGQGGRTSSGSAKQQFEGVWRELTGPERGTLSALQKARSPQEAARIFSEKFERPSIPMLGNRERYALEAAGGKGIAGSETGSQAPASSSRGSGSYLDTAAFLQAGKRAVLANLLKSEGQSAKNNPLFASGLLSGKTPERSEFMQGGKSGGPASLPTGGSSLPVGNGPPGNPNLKPAPEPKLPARFKALEQGKVALQQETGKPATSAALMGALRSGAEQNYVNKTYGRETGIGHHRLAESPVIAVHPAGNVVKTDKGPVFMPHKRTR